MIVMLVVLTIGWVVLSVREALADTPYSGLYWTLLSVGTIFLVLVLVGVVLYLSLSIKAINLNRRQSNFIDSVTHELKSPIASLKLYLQTLEHRRVPVEQQGDFYRVMLEDVARLDRLINHMLAAAQLDQEPVDGQFDEVDLSEVLATCAEAVCANYRVAQETIQLHTEPLFVRSRPFELDLVFRNLIDNAIKYAGTPPEVIIESESTGDGLTITRITDNGRGIPHPYRWKVFARFVRLGSELERDKPGTGLGLYIVRTLVKRLGGRVSIRDRDSGTGTVFEVLLPGTPVVSSPTATQASADPALETHVR